MQTRSSVELHKEWNSSSSGDPHDIIFLETEASESGPNGSPVEGKRTPLANQGKVHFPEFRDCGITLLTLSQDYIKSQCLFVSRLIKNGQDRIFLLLQFKSPR